MFDFPDKIKLDRLRERFDRNYRVSRLFSEYLTSYPALIDAEMMLALECQPEEEAAVIGAEKGSAAIRAVLDSFGEPTAETLRDFMKTRKNIKQCLYSQPCNTFVLFV